MQMHLELLLVIVSFKSTKLLAPSADVQVTDTENVLYDRKNMWYEELLDFVVDNRMLVPCCIDAHFTALQGALT